MSMGLGSLPVPETVNSQLHTSLCYTHAKCIMCVYMCECSICIRYVHIY